MGKKDREGLSKRELFREKRRSEQRRNRTVAIILIVFGALAIVGLFVAPPLIAQFTPVTAVVQAPAREHPKVDRNSVGDANAPVKLDLYSDYQCPYCKRFWQDTEEQVVSTYVATGKVLFTARSAGNWVSGNGGGSGTESQDAAAAAYCAADQGKFWQMNDALFANNLDVEDGTAFTTRRLRAIAESVGLEMTAFDSCFTSQTYVSQVTKDGEDFRTSAMGDPAAATQGFGTPYFALTYVVNGETKIDRINGAQPFSVFQEKIDAALAAVGAK